MGHPNILLVGKMYFLYTVQRGGGAVLLKYATSLFSNSAYNQKLIIAKSVSVIISNNNDDDDNNDQNLKTRKSFDGFPGSS